MSKNNCVHACSSLILHCASLVKPDRTISTPKDGLRWCKLLVKLAQRHFTYSESQNSYICVYINICVYIRVISMCVFFYRQTGWKRGCIWCCPVCRVLWMRVQQGILGSDRRRWEAALQHSYSAEPAARAGTDACPHSGSAHTNTTPPAFTLIHNRRVYHHFKLFWFINRLTLNEFPVCKSFLSIEPRKEKCLK